MNEADNLQEPQGNGVLPCVSGLLFLHDIEELDSIILELNRREITLEEFVSKVWNTGYTLGRKDGYQLAANVLHISEGKDLETKILT